MTKTLYVRTKECKDTRTGAKFIAYKACGKNGRFQNLRFTTPCINRLKSEGREIPTEDFILDAEEEDLSVDNNRLYPIVYCYYFTIHDEEVDKADRLKRNRQALEELFD